MNRMPKSRILSAFAVFALVGLAACDNPVDADEHGEPVGAMLVDRDTGVMLAETHGTGSSIHWDGELPVLQPGEGIEVDVVFVDADGTEIPMGGEFTVRASVAAGAPAGIVNVSEHGDHVDIEGVAVGTTSLVFSLWHGGHADWDSPALSVEVNQND